MENNSSDGWTFKVATIVILAVLLTITGLLVWQNHSLKQQVASLTPPAVPQAQVPQPSSATPAVAAPEISAVPAPAASVKKPASAASSKRNYTQAKKELPAPIPPQVEAAPAPVARVVPTDVIPAEPVPFPRTEQLPPARPVKISATIPSGTILTVRLLDTLNTDRNQAGDRFRASLDGPIVVDGNVVVPRGTTVEGRLVEAQQAGRVKGVAEMTLGLSQLRMPGGETVALETGFVRREGGTSTGEDAAKVGTGAAIGAVIGAIGGGGKGAAIGAATGAGAGTAGVLLTRGKPLILSQETVLSFPLNAPVTMEITPGQASEVSAAQPQRSAPANDGWNRDRPRLRRRRFAP